jgi:hypothetical protein
MVEWIPFLSHIMEISTNISARRRTVLTEIFRDFPQSFQEISGEYLELGHELFLSHPFEFIIYYSSCYSTLTLKSLRF